MYERMRLMAIGHTKPRSCIYGKVCVGKYVWESKYGESKYGESKYGESKYGESKYGKVSMGK